MQNLSRRAKVIIVGITIITLLIFLFAIYKYQKIRIFDKSKYKELCNNLEVDSEQFTKQKDLRKYITHWADDNDLKYSVDEAKNIIFTTKASARKKKVSPTVLIVNYNYENAKDNRRSLATAAMVAYTKLESGKKTVVFVNNEHNDGSAYAMLDPGIISKHAKVIYLDNGKQSYISTRSFNQLDQTVTVPAEKEDITCDTAIRIRIGNIRSDVIDAGIGKQINPINLMSTVLTRLKSKSTICQIADIKIENHGYMYPTGAEMTVMLNSYAAESFKAYLDKRIKAFDKAVKEAENEEAFYEYEVIKDDSKHYPETAYTKSTFNKLTTVLYAIKNGTYRYDDQDVIAEGYEENDIYGINCVRQLTASDNAITIDVTAQSINKSILKEVTSNNVAACELSGCSITDGRYIPAFYSKSESLVRTLKATYFKVNDLAGENVTLNEDYDTYFTPMAYIKSINAKADIVHVKESSKSANVITNMLLCYIETKGNFLSL